MPTHNHPFFVVASAGFMVLLFVYLLVSVSRPSPEKTEVRTLRWIALAATSVAGAFALAWALARPQLSTIRRLQSAPRTTLASPVAAPAVYTGSVVGPDDRVDGNGVRAAATWWWVIRSRSRGRDVTVCFEESYRGMTLRDASGRTAALTAFDRHDNLSLEHDSNTDEWDGPIFIDLGDRRSVRSDQMPAFAARCAGAGRNFKGESIPSGARVQVLACHRNGVLDRCEGTDVAAVLAVGDLDSHVARRQAFALDHFLAAACFGLYVTLAMLFWASGTAQQLRDRVTPPERPL